jgi:hypothetical protein
MKTKLTKIAVTPHFMPSRCAIRKIAPASRPCDGFAARIGHHLRLAAAALLLAAAPLSAEAQNLNEGYFTLPAADVEVAYGSLTSPTRESAYDVNLMRPFCESDRVRSAALYKLAASASAQAGKGFGHYAMARSSDFGAGAARAEAGTWVVVTDPQGRETVKLKMTIKGFASAPDPLALSTGADYQVYVARALGGTPRAVLLDDGCTVYSAQGLSSALARPLILHVGGYDIKTLDLEGNVHTTSGFDVYSYEQLIGRAPQSPEPMDLTFEVEPNRNIVVVVSAGSVWGGMAVVDPVITAHPDNPDVKIEIPYVPDEVTGRHPLDGLTAEDLAALRIDPQPFVDLGFLAPSSGTPPPPPPPSSSGDTTSPETTASATPNANVAGWNNTPVTVTLSATDNAGGSGVKEVHYSLVGAMTGSQIVPGASTTVTISTEGATTLSYFAVDNAGNPEATKTLIVRIDGSARCQLHALAARPSGRSGGVGERC